MSTPTTIRWGILATGGIALTFTKDLLVDPSTRGVFNIRHTVVAAASSSSAARARSFLQEVGAPPSARHYGSYEELVRDTDVDIVYIATPHSHHFQNAMLCLEAGKNVLCEKPFTVNATQAKLLVQKAKEKGCFLMEALWTRYFPLTAYVVETIKSGKIGHVMRVISDCSFGMDPQENFKDGRHRMVNPDLAGGALLDLGIYSLTWPFLALYETQPPNQRKPPKVLAAMAKVFPTYSADETSTIVLSFPRDNSAGGDAHAVATASISIHGVSPKDPSPVPSVRIQGLSGEIQLFPCAQDPRKTRLVLSDGTVEEKEWIKPGPGKGSGWYNGFLHFMNPEGEGQGMFWEADEAANALIEGRKESRLQGWNETIQILETMDEIRRQGELKYPEKVETGNYPTEL